MGTEATRDGEIEATIDVGGIYKPGEKAFLESRFPTGRYEAVFEDDGDAGYFYALDLSLGGNPVVDTVDVYDVALVTDRAKFSVFKIAWSLDGQQALLVINDHLHAVFDFAACLGYCRRGFPEARSPWRRSGLESAPRFLCIGVPRAGGHLSPAGAE